MSVFPFMPEEDIDAVMKKLLAMNPWRIKVKQFLCWHMPSTKSDHSCIWLICSKCGKELEG